MRVRPKMEGDTEKDTRADVVSGLHKYAREVRRTKSSPLFTMVWENSSYEPSALGNLVLITLRTKVPDFCERRDEDDVQARGRAGHEGNRRVRREGTGRPSSVVIDTDVIVFDTFEDTELHAEAARAKCPGGGAMNPLCMANLFI